MMKTILYYCNCINYFSRHRLHLALASYKSNYRVIIAAGNSQDIKSVLPEGITVIHTDLVIGRFAPISDIKEVFRLVKIIKSEKVELVHVISIKAILVYSFARLLLFTKPVAVINFAGLGRIFHNKNNIYNKFRKKLVVTAISLLLKSNTQIKLLENSSNYRYFVASGMFDKVECRQISGSGFEPDRIIKKDYNKKPLKIVFASRLLFSKGLLLFCKCAEALFLKIPGISFEVAGWAEKSDKDRVSKSYLEDLAQRKIIVFHGQLDKDEVSLLLEEAHIVCLPTNYPEGTPRILIESFFAGCVTIATKSPGAIDLITHNKTGIFLRNNSLEELQSAITKLVKNPAKIEEIGSRAQDFIVKSSFTKSAVEQEVQQLYKELLLLK